MPVVDFTDVETTEFEPVPAGRYLTRVEECEEKEGTEHPYLNFKHVIVDGEFEGRFIFDIASFSPKALWKLKGVLIASGYTEEDLAGELEINPEEFLEVEYELVVTIAPDNNGIKRNRVTKHFAA